MNKQHDERNFQEISRNQKYVYSRKLQRNTEKAWVVLNLKLNNRADDRSVNRITAFIYTLFRGAKGLKINNGLHDNGNTHQLQSQRSLCF